MTVPTQPVTVRLADFGGPALAGVKVTARLSDVDYTTAGTFVSTDKVVGTTDASGVVVLDLFPNAVAPTGLGTRGTTVRVTASLPGSRGLDVEARIPDTPCNLVDVLVPLGDVPLTDAQLALLAVQSAAAQAVGAAEQTEFIYPGVYADNPTARPDGSAIQAGDQYFNSVANLTKRFNGATWVASDINTANLAASGGDSLLGAIGSGAGAVAETQQDINRQRVRLSGFLTPSQRTAMRTNDWTGINITTFTAAVQAALTAAQGKTLEISTPAFIKVNSPLVWPEITAVVGLGVPNSTLGVVFFPDLSVDWPTLYPDQGVLTADKYLFGYAGHESVTAGFWTGIGKQFQVRADGDAALYAASKTNVPDYGIALWACNESTYFEHVQVLRFRKHDWLVGGVSAVPTFVHCTGFLAGDGQNTIFGDAVTRGAGAFGAAVTVYWNVSASTTVYLEAAAATDLDTLAPADVLTINGTAYTVATVPVATASIAERSVIAGVTTTTRSQRRVTLTAPLTANGRVYHAGIAFRNHPNLTFAPGVSAALGGRGNSGSARLFGFSGDNNGALVFVDGAQTLAVVSPKSESNNSLIHISGNQNGGSRARVEVSGYRADGFGTFDGGLVRITGTSRPSVRLGTGQLVSYVNVVNDQTSTGEVVTAASQYGLGGMFYCKDNTEIPSFSKLRAGEMTVGDGANSGLLSVVDGSDNVNRRMAFGVNNATDIYTWKVGPGGGVTVFSVGANTGNNAHLWAYNGAGVEKIVRMSNVGGVAAVLIGLSAAQKVGFFAATPVVQQTVPAAAADPATTMALANALRTALVNLGLAV